MQALINLSPVVIARTHAYATLQDARQPKRSDIARATVTNLANPPSARLNKVDSVEDLTEHRVEKMTNALASQVWTLNSALLAREYGRYRYG